MTPVEQRWASFPVTVCCFAQPLYLRWWQASPSPHLLGPSIAIPYQSAPRVRRRAPAEILALIGAGGMGEVYRARDTKLNARSRIKVLPRVVRGGSRSRRALPARSASPRLAESSEHREDLRAGGADGVSALVMELVEGRRSPTGSRSGAIPARRSAADREADRRSAGSSARAGDHPSRSQAREHQGAAGRHGEGAGLRTGQSAGAGAPSRGAPSVAARRRSRAGDDDRRRRDPRHGGVHVAGAGEGASRPTSAATSGRSGACSTRCSRASARSKVRMSPTCSPVCWRANRTGVCHR